MLRLLEDLLCRLCSRVLYARQDPLCNFLGPSSISQGCERVCACAGKPITLRAALARYADLLSPVSKPSLQALSVFAEGDDQARLRRLLSPDGAAEYKAWHQQSRSLLEVMEEFPSCQPPLGKLRTLPFANALLHTVSCCCRPSEVGVC